MKVLGIDPGTASLGWGVIEGSGSGLRLIEAGCHGTTPDQGLPERLLSIQRHVDGLIARHRPDQLAVERLFFSRNAQTAFAVGQARGVVLACAAGSGVPVREATPSEVKLAVTGSGTADKDQVGRMVAVCLSLKEPPRPDDTADALAIAIWAANSDRSTLVAAAAGAGGGSAVLDRAAVAPMTRGESPFDRAVREAIAREKKAASRP